MATVLTATVTGDLTIAPPATVPPSDSQSTGCNFGLSIRSENQSPAAEISQGNAAVASPAAFVALPFPTNLTARVFYFRRKSGGPFDLKLTHATAGATTYPKVFGLFFGEFDAAEQITAVTIQGTGEFEWAAFGPTT